MEVLQINSLYLVVLMGFILSTVTFIWRERAEKADQDPANIAKDQEAEKKYAGLCESDETINVICRGNKEEYYVLTDKRLIIDNKNGLQSIPFDTIKKVKLQKLGGGKAGHPSLCQIITINADRKYTLARYSQKFNEIAAFFIDRQ